MSLQQRARSVLSAVLIVTATPTAPPIPVITIPVGNTPPNDATCDIGFGDAAALTIAATGTPVKIKRDGAAVWVCVKGVQVGSRIQRISLYLDIKRTRATRPDVSDLVLGVTNDGKMETFAGQNGGYVPAPNQGWSVSTRINPAEFASWNAEFRIPSTTLLGWNHVIGIAVESSDEGNPGSPTLWPDAATRSRPDTWADLLLSGATWQAPPGGCIASLFFPLLHVSASPDLGLAKPDVVVVGGSKVSLTGFAASVSFLPSCTQQSIGLPFAWTLTFQAPSGLPQDATAALANANTLTPTFSAASGPGNYFATLHAGPWSVTQRIDVLRPGGGWYSIGPDMGRVNSIAFDPGSPGTVYAASALGGVWKSIDRGGTWFPVSDQKGLPTLAAGPLAIDTDGTIYVGAGDLYPNANINQTGGGIYKSNTGGFTWSKTGTSTTSGCTAFSGQAARIAVHPNNTFIIYAATDAGLLRSLDAGNCWTLIPGINAASDLVIDPVQPLTIYVASPSQGILRVTNANGTNPSVVALLSAGAAAYGNIKLSISPGPSPVLYAAVANPTGSLTWILERVPAGWAIANNSVCTAQCSYGIALAISPIDSKHVFFGEVKPHESNNSGTSFNGLRHGAHDDFHQLLFAPDDPNTLYAATDGGVYRLNLTGNTDWESLNDHLSIAQAPTLASGPSASAASIGVWDNGTQQRTNNTRQWHSLHGGDGFNAAIDASSDNIVYLNTNAGINGDILRSPDGHALGSAAGFLSSPYRAGELMAVGVVGKDAGKLFVTEGANSGDPHWICADPLPAGPALFSLDFAPGGAYFGTLWDGTVYRFTLPSSPRDISKCSSGTAADNVLKVYQAATGQALSVANDPFDPNSIYVLAPNDQNGQRIVRVSQQNGVWSGTALAGTADAANALPSVTLSNAIGADPVRQGVLYVGSQHGLWTGVPQTDGAYSWSLDPDVPDTWIMGVVPHRTTAGYSGAMKLTTYGRGVWERSSQITCPRAICILRPPICFTCIRVRWWEPLMGSQMSSASTAILEIPYQFDSTQGTSAFIQATAMDGSRPNRSFAVERQPISPGVGVAMFALVDGGRDGPALTKTTSVSIAVLDSRGDTLTRYVMPLQKTWVRLDSHLVTIDAAVTDPGPATIDALLSVRINSGNGVYGKTHVEIAASRRATASITAAESARTSLGTWRFVGWSVNDKSVGTNPQLQITISGDTRVVAHYERVSRAIARSEPVRRVIPLGAAIRQQ